MDGRGRKKKTSGVAASRAAGNAATLFVAGAILFLTAKMADGGFTSRISEISETLDRAIFDVLNDAKEANYTEIDGHGNVTYHSDTYFNPKGMAGLYNLTIKFMDLIVNKNIIPEYLLNVTKDGHIEIAPIEDYWKELLLYYSGLLAVVLVLLLFAVFLPLCGFCFCCCRCCGRCGARSKPFDKKHDLCKKILLATVLIALGTLMLFGVVCAFVSNQHMEDGQEELVGNLHVNINDTRTYLSVTERQVDVLFVKNVHEFTDFIFDILAKTSNITYERLTEMTNAISVTELSNIVNGLTYIKANLTILKNSTNDLRANATNLNDGLRTVKGRLFQVVEECIHLPPCKTLWNNYVSALNTDISFDSLPNVQEQVNALDNVMKTGIEQEMQEGLKKLEKMRLDIEKAIQTQLGQVRTAIGQAGDQVMAGASNVTKVLSDARQFLDEGDKQLDIYEDYAKRYSPYRYYAGLIVSCILLLVAICIALGLICGVCGKRPDAYGDDCCNKGAGSRFLMCAVLIMFLLGIVLVVVVLVCFLVGVVAERAVCEPLRNPNDSHVLRVADELLSHRSSLQNVNVTSVILSCRRNESVYKALRLEAVFDVEKVKDYVKEFKIKEALEALEENLKGHTENINIFENGTRKKLEELRDSKLDKIDFDRFINLVENNFTTVNLNDFANELEKVGAGLPPDVKPSIEPDLRSNAQQLRKYQEQLVEPMWAAANNMVIVAGDLKEGLKFNRSSFENAIDSLIKEVEGAEKHLRENGTAFLVAIVQNFSVSIEGHVRGFLDRIIDNTVENVGRCGPASLVLDSTLTSTCDKILLPLNGFWFGVFWSLVLFLPTIVVSVKLATLYQKYNPYSGPLIEAEYLYDAYGDRDSIPLHSDGYAGRGAKPGRKKQKKKAKRYENRSPPGASGDAVVGDYAGASHQETRYADMAPKHWEDFPANGPPQYQRAPTEYERPPPYYYPGTGETQ